MSTDASTPAHAEPLVIAGREGSITRITLNRPRAISALTLEMFELIGRALEVAQSDGSSAILLDGAGELGFCGGGDIKEISSGDSLLILSTEYRLDLALAESRVPVVGVMDGITMGGGIGLAGHAKHRVVTERSRLAMPEVRIGIVPDVGGHLLLAHAPGRLGEMLAVTAGEMGPGDAIALGFADYFVPSERLAALGEALAGGEDPATACARLAEPAPDSPVLAAGEWWGPIAEEVFGAQHPPAFEDAAGTAARVIRALETAGDDGRIAAEWAAETVRGMCPVSVAVTLAQIDRTRRLGLSLAEVLADDLRVLGRIAARPDFAEGVRAQVIDKDRTPRWSPSRIEDLDPAELEAILAP